jgi:hypothetical protein
MTAVRPTTTAPTARTAPSMVWRFLRPRSLGTSSLSCHARVGGTMSALAVVRKTVPCEHRASEVIS